MKKIFILIMVSISVSIHLYAQSTTNMVSSEIKFSIQNAGLTVNGALSNLSGEINFDPAKLSSSSIDVSVPISSIKTGIEMRDSHLKKEEYFNAAKYADIRLKSSFFVLRNEQYIGYFMLTLKGVSKNITIPFTASMQNGLLVLVGEFTLDRLDYKVGGKSLVMGNEVKVKLLVKVKQ